MPALPGSFNAVLDSRSLSQTAVLFLRRIGPRNRFWCTATADPNWRVDRNTCGAYRGWEGNCFAWSGGQGEAATGRLRSKPFLLDKDAVRLLMQAGTRRPGRIARGIT